MKVFVVVGEQSGDNHAASVIDQLQKLDNTLDIQGWGGDAMQASGTQITRHFKAYSAMGFWEIITHLAQYRRLLRDCYQEINRLKPDAVLLVDFGGFNLRLARILKLNGYKVAYYIPPKVWSWGSWRVSKLRRYCDQILVTLPFEKDFFGAKDIAVEYVGNPVKEQVDLFNAKLLDIGTSIASDYVVILPGSRNQEVSVIIPLIRVLVMLNGNVLFKISKASSVESSLYEPVAELQNVQLFEGNNYEIVANSKAAIVTSGTSTLEVALLNIPQVVIYKTSRLTYVLATLLSKVKFISLVNLLLKREVVKELIQDNLNIQNLQNELDSLLVAGEKQQKISEGYSEIFDLLGSQKASQNVARAIYQLGSS